MKTYELKVLTNELSRILISIDECPEDDKLIIEYFNKLKLLNHYSEKRLKDMV